MPCNHSKIVKTSKSMIIAIKTRFFVAFLKIRRSQTMCRKNLTQLTDMVLKEVDKIH